VNYHLAAIAAARGDSLNDPKAVDGAMWATIDQELAQKYIDNALRTSGTADTAGLDDRYLRGEFLAAQHILFAFPAGARGKLASVQDSIRRRAERIRLQVTSDNFTKLAQQYTEEPDGQLNNGRTGVVTPGTWVPEFEAAVRALKPGGVSPALVKTQFGYHIIRRQLLSEVREEYLDHIRVHDVDGEIAHVIAKLSSEYRLTAQPGLAAVAKQVAVDPEAWVSDKTVVVTSVDNEFTGGRLANSILAYPRLAGNNLRVRLVNAPDSVVVRIVRDTIAGKQLVAAAARRANLALAPTERSSIRGMFRQYATSMNRELRIDSKSLGDGTPAERERLAVSRAEQAFDRVFATGGNDFVEVRTEVASALRTAYPWAVNFRGYNRVVSRAVAIRAALDSTHAPKPKG
jgi:hypothetical protein